MEILVSQGNERFGTDMNDLVKMAEMAKLTSKQGIAFVTLYMEKLFEILRSIPRTTTSIQEEAERIAPLLNWRRFPNSSARFA